MQMYRVKTPFVLVRPTGSGAFESVSLAPGALISVRMDRTILRSGLVDVLFDGKILAAHLRDVVDRAECVDAQAS
jgi:hypothetical protein